MLEVIEECWADEAYRLALQDWMEENDHPLREALLLVVQDCILRPDPVRIDKPDDMLRWDLIMQQEPAAVWFKGHEYGRDASLGVYDKEAIRRAARDVWRGYKSRGWKCKFVGWFSFHDPVQALETLAYVMRVHPCPWRTTANA